MKPHCDNRPRIVSLIASATEIIHALGMGDHQVGRSHECDFPSSVFSLPVCTAPKFSVAGSSREIDSRVKATLRSATSVYDVFEDILEQLRPTHIVTQSQCDVCAVSLRDVEQALAGRLGCAARIVSLEPNCLADIWNDIRSVSESLEISPRGEGLIVTLQSRLSSLACHADLAQTKPRVACLEWVEPLMAAGNWVPELVNMAGAIDLFGQAGKHSPWMSWDQLVTGDPEVIVVMPCGFDLKKTAEEMYWLVDRVGWSDLRAVKNGRVYPTDGNQFFNRPGPRIVESLQILGEVLHPDLFEPKLMNSGWQPLA
jgi:iron complex transport system substrate-binding protein